MLRVASAQGEPLGIAEIRTPPSWLVSLAPWGFSYRLDSHM